MTDVLVSAYGFSVTAAGEGGVLSAAYSDDGSHWAWMQVPTSWAPQVEATAASVGLASFGNAIWCAFRGETTTTLYAISSSTWDHVDTGQSTRVGPAIAVFDDKLWVAYIGESTGHVEVINSSDGTGWDASHSTGQSSHLGPAMTVFDNKLWVAYIGESTGNVEVINSSDGKTWHTGRPGIR
jgi:hypothetical protein